MGVLGAAGAFEWLVVPLEDEEEVEGPAPLEEIVVESLWGTLGGGVLGLLSWRIFWMTRALVRTGFVDEEEEDGAKVTEPKSSSPGKSSSLKPFETFDELLLLLLLEVP